MGNRQNCAKFQESLFRSNEIISIFCPPLFRIRPILSLPGIFCSSGDVFSTGAQNYNHFWPGLGLPRPKAIVVIPQNQPLPKHLRKKTSKSAKHACHYATKRKTR